MSNDFSPKLILGLPGTEIRDFNTQDWGSLRKDGIGKNVLDGYEADTPDNVIVGFRIKDQDFPDLYMVREVSMGTGRNGIDNISEMRSHFHAVFGKVPKLFICVHTS